MLMKPSPWLLQLALCLFLLLSAGVHAANPRLTGYRVLSAGTLLKVPVILSDGTLEIPSVGISSARLRFFGEGLSEDWRIELTRIAECHVEDNFYVPVYQEYTVVNGTVQYIDISLRSEGLREAQFITLHVCYFPKDPAKDQVKRYPEEYNDGHPFMVSIVPPNLYGLYMPTWASAVLIIFLFSMSGLFSGLNLGLMALDTTGLKIVMASGSAADKKRASKIMPLRKHGNYLLCTILFGNVAVNTFLTLLMDKLISGHSALIFTTLGIVIFGEIVPQAICTKYGLAVGAALVGPVWVFAIMSCWFSWPISFVLDKILGQEVGTFYNRAQLLELLKYTEHQTDLESHEMDLLSGALEFSRKEVRTVMTELTKVFMLDITSKIDFELTSLILKKGYSRVPVYENERENIVGILFVKDLAFVDPEDETSLSTVIGFYNHHVYRVFEDQKLDEMLNEFKKGRCHMAVVQTVNDTGEGDPFYETKGIVTLEDIIEELIQSEIVDETDVYNDNTHLKIVRKPEDFRPFADGNTPQACGALAPQMALAAFSFLWSEVPAFGKKYMTKGTLKRILQMAYIKEFKGTNVVKDHEIIYKKGERTQVFTLILEGRAKVICGREDFDFERGPFSYFGEQALTGGTAYEPDFSVGIVGPAQVLMITRTDYKAMLRPAAGSVSVSDSSAGLGTDHNATGGDNNAPKVVSMGTCPNGAAVAIDVDRLQVPPAEQGGEHGSSVDSTTALLEPSPSHSASDSEDYMSELSE